MIMAGRSNLECTILGMLIQLSMANRASPLYLFCLCRVYSNVLVNNTNVCSGNGFELALRSEEIATMGQDKTQTINHRERGRLDGQRTTGSGSCCRS